MQLVAQSDAVKEAHRVLAARSAFEVLQLDPHGCTPELAAARRTEIRRIIVTRETAGQPTTLKAAAAVDSAWAQISNPALLQKARDQHLRQLEERRNEADIIDRIRQHTVALEAKAAALLAAAAAAADGDGVVAAASTGVGSS